MLALIVGYLQFVGQSGKEVGERPGLRRAAGRPRAGHPGQGERPDRGVGGIRRLPGLERLRDGRARISCPCSDPTLTYTTGPSTSVTVVSVASSAAAWAAAVLAPSGTCYWVKLGAMALPTYGTGTTCTGAAAMAASHRSW